MKLKYTFLLFVLIMFTGCDVNKMKINKIVEATNELCPINMGISGDLLSIKYDKRSNEVQYYYSLNEEKTLSIDFIAKHKITVLKYIKLSLNKSENKDFLNLLIAAKSTIKTTYKSSSTGRTTEIFISPHDLININDSLMSEREISLMLLDSEIFEVNQETPIYVDEGIEIENVRNAKEHVVIYFRIDKETPDIIDWKDSKSLRLYILFEMALDSDWKEFMKTLISLDKGIIFSYSDGTQTTSVEFSSEELQEVIAE